MASDRPLCAATPWQAVRLFWTGYALFVGRASRREFWWWTLFAVLVALLLELIRFAAVGATPGAWWDDYNSGQFAGTSLPGTVWTAATLLPSLALTARRLHDTNRSGWWQLCTFVPIAGWVLLFVLCARRPDARGTRYDRVLPASVPRPR